MAAVLFEELKAVGLNEPKVLDDLCSVVVESGCTSLDDLLRLSGEEKEELFEDLAESGVPKQDRRKFKHWLAGQQGDLHKRAPKDFPASHFLNFKDKLNDSDVSCIESATVLRIDIDPIQGSDEKPEYNLRVPSGAIDSQLQKAKLVQVPIIAMVGPTGTGKSFLTSTFTFKETAKKRPVVAAPDQHVPTSANVCAHQGYAHPNSNKETDVLCLDFEGEDGKTPKNLIEKGKKFLFQYLPGGSEETAKAIIAKASNKRITVIKQVLPPLAYLVSDVIIFIDTVELRRTERVDRFAEKAHESVESLPCRPALLIVQNKWNRVSVEEKSFDVTDKYDWIVSGLQSIFSEVKLMRVPAMGDRFDMFFFEKGLHALHNAVIELSNSVAAARKNVGALYSEQEFWFNFNSMIKQFNSGGIGERLLTNMETVVDENRVSSHPADNATRLLRMLGGDSQRDEKFHQMVDKVLSWYAYSLAGEAKCKEAAHVRNGLRRDYNNVLDSCLDEEKCTAKYEDIENDGKIYRCTKQRKGHGKMHSNPAFLKKPAKNWVKRAFSLTFWKDKIPCSWEGYMEPLFWDRSYESFESLFDQFSNMCDEEYLIASSELSGLSKEFWMDTEKNDFCVLCLRTDRDTVLLADTFRHPLCRECVQKRKVMSKEEDQVICPFCHSPCVLSPGKPDASGFRILSLDGGGVRGLVEICVLKQLEERFAPLHVCHLFDIIIGTSVGGIITMALLKGIPLDETEQLLHDMAGKILDVKQSTKYYRMCTNQPICNSSTLEEVLRHTFGGARTKHYQATTPTPPYMLCTCTLGASNESGVIGNYFPSNGSTHFCTLQMSLWEAARATSAAPIYFSPSTHKLDRTLKKEDGTVQMASVDIESVDGGIKANCPAKLGFRIAQEIQADEQEEKTKPVELVVSVGTGAPAKDGAEKNNGGAIKWGKKLINIALDSERLWEEFEELAQSDHTLQRASRIRVNPPNLGSLNAFSSKSIDPLKEGMKSYFISDQGNKKMNELFHMTFAKLWQVPLNQNPVMGEATQFRIMMRERLCDFSKMKDAELRNIIIRRSDDALPDEREDLIEMAKQCIESKPFVPPFPGCFVYMINGNETMLTEGERHFTFQADEVGAHKLEVFWRAATYGDFPICSVPRMIEVIGPQDV